MRTTRLHPLNWNIMSTSAISPPSFYAAYLLPIATLVEREFVASSVKGRDSSELWLSR